MNVADWVISRPLLGHQCKFLHKSLASSRRPRSLALRGLVYALYVRTHKPIHGVNQMFNLLRHVAGDVYEPVPVSIFVVGGVLVFVIHV